MQPLTTPSQKKKGHKLDIAAQAWAEMELGTYSREGYTLRYNQQGEPIPSMTEALRKGGFSHTYQELHAACRDGEGRWGEYFQERVAFHRSRLSGGYKKELALITNNGLDISKIRSLAFESIMRDLEDPNASRRISFKDRAHLYLELTKLEAETKGHDKAENTRYGLTIRDTIINNINDPQAQQRLLEKIAEKEAAYTQEVEDVLVVGEYDEE